MAQLLGIDIGGTGVKGAPVDLDSGELTDQRDRIPTPHPATPDAVAATVAEIVASFDVPGPVGCTIPAVVQSGIVRTAANIDDSWIGTDAASVISTACGGRPVAVLNDADAAGLAEVTHGAGKGRSGTVVCVTLGTGIGTALFHDGALLPNTELGHLELDGTDAELEASNKVREDEDLSWKKWAKRVDAYLEELDRLVWPDLVIIGGGVSKHADKFLPRVHTRVEVVPAALHNEAGIVGAALAAHQATTPGPTKAS
jgi:polyphosphate glucokinase